MTRFTFNRTAAFQALILLFLLTPVVGTGLFMWFKHQQFLAGLADNDPRYARLQGLINHQADLQALTGKVNDALMRLTYPASQDVAKAGNDAQQSIRSLFADSHLEIISIQVMPAKEEGQFNRISISLRVEGDLAGLQSALEKLPGLTPMVLVDNMSLQTIGAVRPASVQRLGAQFSLSVFRVRS
jgi:general secretion pathway protein M